MADKEKVTRSMSYVCGASNEPLIYSTIGVAFDEAAKTWAENEALVVRHQNVRWSYAQLKEKVDAVAAGLIALGLEPGTRIGIWSQNNWEWVVIQFAAAKAGLILVTINPAFRSAELEYVLNKVEAEALVIAPRFKSSDYISILNLLAPELALAEPGELRSEAVPNLRLVISLGDDAVPGMLGFSEVLAAADLDARRRVKALESQLEPDDPINIQFTSGTTGSPKGATLSHFNILNNAYFTGKVLRLSDQDRLCIPVPLYHCFGMVLASLGCMTHGSTMVFPDEAFDPGSVLETVTEEKCTALYGVPTMFIAELGHPDFQSFDLSSLRTGIMAGAPCPIEVMKRVISDMHMKEVTIAYGMTETSPISFQSGADDSIDRRVATVGRVHPHVEVKIVDAEGHVAPIGIQGELLTRGYSVMREYWNDPERTAEAIDEAGWMHTGDLATLDEEGYCKITGRLKDMVIRGGENVYPREIEEFLYRHPEIDDVHVFGVPDPKFGEELCAWVRLRSDSSASAEEIREYCRGQIAHYKVPRYIRLVEEYPMTVTGKVQKFMMRKVMVEELGISEK